MIETIFHVADIHIKKANHDHILFSWDKFIELIISHPKPNILIIAGDIFDHKMYLEASDISVFNKMLKSLNDHKIRTFMMPGNHDYNINGANDDKIKALMESNSYEYIKHFSTSETFDYENLSLCFHSPVDGGLPKPTLNKKSIAIVHEPITGSKTDGGIVFRKQRFSASDFTNNFNMTMIGDIHLPQLLAPNVAYCGSFVQTNKGEGIEHGCMVWDVATGKPTFKPIQQLSVHVRVFASNNTIKTELPNVVARSVNLYHENCTEAFLMATGIQIKKQFDREIDSTTNKTKIDGVIEKATISEINDILRNQLAENGVCVDQLGRIMEHHHKLFESTGRKSVPDWKIKFLSWSNLYCYGENNYINFDNLTNLFAIIGPNKTGKSSIIDILILVLFNETNRGSKKHALNTESTKGFIKCVISVGKDIYIVERAWIDPNTSVVRLWHNGLNISGSDINDSYNKLSEVVGNRKMFVNSVAALQQRQFLVDISAKERYDLICRMMELDKLRDAEDQNATELRAMKKQLASIPAPEDKTDKLTKLMAKQEFNKTESIKLNKEIGELRSRQITISPDIIANLRNTKIIRADIAKVAKLKPIECDIPKLVVDIANKEISVRISEQELLTIDGSIRTIPVPPLNLTELRKKANCVGDVAAIAQSIIELKTSVATAKASIATKQIIGNNFTVLPESHFEIIKKSIEASQSKMEKLRTDLVAAQFSSANGLIGAEMKWNDSCADCCANKTRFVVSVNGDAETIKKALNKEIASVGSMEKRLCSDRDQNKISAENLRNRDDVEKLNDIVSTSEKKLVQLTEQYENLMNVAKLQSELETIDRNITMLSDLNARRKVKDAELSTNRVALMNMRKLLSDAQAYEKNCASLKALNDELVVAEQCECSTSEMNEIRAELLALEKQVATLNDGKLSAEIANIKAQIKSDRTIIDSRERLNSSISDMEIYNTVINHKTGLPVKMMENTCKGIETSANELLAVIADFTISVVFDKEIHINIGQVSAEQSSGYQKFVIDLILRQVLCTLTLSAHPRILFIDEGFGSLDVKNFAIVCREMLPRLASRFEKVIIISHVPTIHNHIPSNCVISRVDGRSHIQFGESDAELITTKLIEDAMGEKADKRATAEIAKKAKNADEIATLSAKATEMGMSVFDRINDKELHCRICNKTIKVRTGSAEKHIASATHIKKFKPKKNE